jgi:2-methylcitrate dehydratase PrpD
LVDAKFSLPFLVAVAAVQRDVRLADFAPTALSDAEVLALARRVTPVEDRALDWKHELPDGVVEIVTRDGQRFKHTGTDVPGSATAPMTWDDIARKFDDCASAAVHVLPAETLTSIRRATVGLEEVADATVPLRMMAPDV